MALGVEEEEDYSVRTRNYKINRRIKFSIDDKVEVRSEEDGFQGSWHLGTVDGCKNCDKGVIYDVKYDHILVDDGSDHLVDKVFVPNHVDENSCSTSMVNYRGHIRPLPPLLNVQKWNLPNGMCVDVLHNEGWWEGVVFDHEDGSEDRKIFFPDLGDELVSHIGYIRITQDWNDVTGTWQNRGTWLFLELIEELEQECYVPVSTKQLWYDLREKKDFQKLVDWTSKDKDTWRNLVSDAINDNFKVFMKHLFEEVGFTEGAQGVLECAKPFNDANTYPEAVWGQNHAVSVGDMSNSNMFYPKYSNANSIQQLYNEKQLASLSLNNGSNMHLLTKSKVSCPEKRVCMLPQVLPSNQDGISVTISTNNEKGFSSSNADKITEKYSSSMCIRSNWLSAVPQLVPGAEFCPDSVIKYALGKRMPQSSIVDVRKHLLHLNWRIEYSRQSGVIKLRYISPDGVCYYSLRQVCICLSKSHADTLPSMSQNEDTILFNSPSSTAQDEGTSFFSLPGNSSCLLIEQSPQNQDSLVSSQSDFVVIEPKYCPEAAVQWFKHGFGKRPTRRDRKEMILRAKRHLSALGWQFRYVSHNGRLELHYESPSGKLFNSLRMACKYSMNGGASPTFTQLERKTVSKVVKAQAATEKISSALRKMGSQKLENFSSDFSCISRLRKTMVPQKLKLGGTRQFQKKRKEGLHLSFFSHQQEANSDGQRFHPKMRKGTKSRGLFKLRSNKNGSQTNCVLRSHKRVQQVVVSTPSHLKPRTVLSWLIDNNVVLPRARVHYCSIKGRRPIAEGRITRDGIKCNCCGKVYTLSNFELHVTGKYSRPTSSIFLEDGRSLLDCQMQIIHDEMRNFAAESPEMLKGSSHQGENDHICSVCHYGGELILCDQCPSSFHKTCLRMEIFLGLHKLLGKPLPVGLNNLTWTLLKHIQSDGFKLDSPDIEALTENYSKLNIALDVMHECFEPVEEPLTKRDLLKDVIFSKESKLNRLNFRGFYTVLLQKDDEFITVATVRVYGEKVAEIPLVGTRFQYRRLGMCRILIDILEKKLMELGVERLILPAVPSVLPAWTGSFGFTKMTDSERSKFLDYTFLDFQDTIMCHKLLIEIPCSESSTSRVHFVEVQPGHHNDASGSAHTIDLDGSRAISAAFEADRMNGGIKEQGQKDVAASNSSSDIIDELIHQEAMVNPTDPHGEPCTSEAGLVRLDCSVEDCTLKEERENGNDSKTWNVESRYDNVDLKCYKRRKILPKSKP
ncbi:hypothetical protein JCGZ_17400 [Jatropha curcas]|uniref:N-acetyltransferase domain-containing protein n=1 Tax=Jatropha curcas TaxID=180498 RepID=A0A067LF08_JATCU|nr:hypothetical protein JCGZ_17400 [Jatropha curcas]